MTQHSVLGASSADRWLRCPASIRLSEGIENKSNVHSRRGTAAHELLSKCLTNKKDAEFYIDETLVVEGEEFDVDQKMCDDVQLCLDTVRGIITEYELAGFTDAEMDSEVRFDLTHIYAGMFGTCDIIIHLPRWKKLVVLDYKNGWGEVDAENNPQIMYYALGALTGKHNRAIEKLELVIVQPKSIKKPVKVWECDVVDLLDFKADLIAGAERTKKPDSEAIPGDHCQYCPASTVPGRCTALENRCYEIAGAEFDMADNVKLTPPEQLSLDKRKVLWENAALLEDWIEKVQKYNHDQALKGDLLPGTKLVRGRKGAKKWKDEELAKKNLSVLTEKGVIKDGIFKTKLKTPTQIAADMAKGDDRLIESLYEQSEGKVSLVYASDPRPSVTIDINKEFEE